MNDYYRPPAPRPRGALSVVARCIATGGNDILRLLPEVFFRRQMMRLPLLRRPTYIVNCPITIRHIMSERLENYPKSPLMTAPLDALVGDSIFTVSGETWNRQRRMIAQVFAKLRLADVFDVMRESVDDYLARLDARVGGTVDIDAEMAHVTADVIFRTMFSRPIQDTEARLIFDEFTRYQDVLPHTTGRSILLTGQKSKATRLPRKAQMAATHIREMIAALLAERRSGKVVCDDICQIIADCRDPVTGDQFTDEEALDQIAFFFLAGHETSASALTWALACLSGDPAIADEVADEVGEATGGGAVTYENRKRLTLTNAVFKEALRLYPSVAFFTRSPIEGETLRGYDLNPGDELIISPWIVQRHRDFWDLPDHFVPKRHLREGGRAIKPGTWMPFGFGPRVCTGAAFATMEAELILAEITRRYRLKVIAPEKVEPVSRLTARPKRRLTAKVERR